MMNSFNDQQNSNEAKKKGNLIILVHGFASDRLEFYNCTKQLNEMSKACGGSEFVDAGVITYKSEDGKTPSMHLSPRDKDGLVEFTTEFVRYGYGKRYIKLPEPFHISPQDMKTRFDRKGMKETIKDLTDKGQNVMLKVEFSNLNQSNQDQMDELRDFINKAKDDSVDLILVGHSKGGLVSLKYASENPDKVKKLVTIGTPYVKNSLLRFLYKTGLQKYIEGPGARDIMGYSNSLTEIREKWNSGSSKKVDTYAIASTYIIDKKSLPDSTSEGIGDAVVATRAQLGEDTKDTSFNDFKKIIIQHDDHTKAIHFEEAKNRLFFKTLLDIIDDRLSLKKGERMYTSKDASVIVNDRPRLLEQGTEYTDLIKQVQVGRSFYNSSKNSNINLMKI